MKISKLARREAKELFRSCQVNGLLDENRVRQAVQRVIAAKPGDYLAVLSQFQRLVKLDIQRHSARVESAVALPPEVQNSLQVALSRKYGRGLEISFAQNPGLIGGMRIRIGSDVYDGSVQGRLKALQESF
jgi:F-type H+-transporting ATPase subunit delta